MASSPYKTRIWRVVRQAVLERDGYVCQLGRPGCTRLATQCDHIVPWLKGGAWFDPANLRASCAGCNSRRADRSWQRRQAMTSTAPTSTPSRDW